jgi:uncharacterized GH25 family protein
MENAVHAHHLWIAKTDDGYEIARGMAPERRDKYNPGRVKEFWAYGPNGPAIPAENIRRIDGSERVRFRVSEPVSMAGVSCDWGYRVNTTEGKKLMTKQEAEKAGFKVVGSFFSTQFAKVVFQDGDRVEKPIGMKFEMVPLESPTKVSPDGELAVRVLFDGKPMENVSIFSREGGEWKTGKDGIGRVKPAAKGLNLLSARHKVPVQGDPDKDYHLYTTFLVFEVQ